MTYPGGLEGGYVELAEGRRELRDWYHPDGGLRGFEFVPDVGLILSWDTMAQEIVEDEWTLSTDGKFAAVRPAGSPSQTRWHQFDATPDVEWWALRDWDAGRPFCVSVYREATPSRDTTSATTPYVYTAVQFGGRYELRLPKWKPVELWRLTGGQWRQVLQTNWQQGEMYSDAHSKAELFITVLPIDGCLLLYNGNATGAEMVRYVEDKPIRLETAAPVMVRGNGGACYFGLHGVLFADGDQYLYSRQPATQRNLWSAPQSVVMGSKPGDTIAEVEVYDGAGLKLDAARWQQLWNSTTHGGVLDVPVELTYTTRLHMARWTSWLTPVVKLAGVAHDPHPIVPEPVWEDVSERVQSVSGTWQVDLAKRIGFCDYTVELDNSDGALRGWDRVRLARLDLGYAGQTLARRADCYIYVDDDGVENIAQATVTARTLDRIHTLDEIECGYRAPLDGMYVWEAVLHILEWAGLHIDANRYTPPAGPQPDGIGYLHMSGRRLPTSRFEATQALGARGVEVRGAGADESRAVVQPDPGQSCLEFLSYVMQYDRSTFAWFGTDGLFYYRPLASVSVTHHMYETEQLDALDAIRKGFSTQTKLREARTSVSVTGRDRATKLALTAYKRDAAAISDGTARGHVGYDRPHRVSDEKCNEWPLVTKRCAWEYAVRRALGTSISFECLGQPNRNPLEALVPHETRTRGGGRTYVITAVKDSLGADRRYTGQIDAVDLEDFLAQVGP